MFFFDKILSDRIKDLERTVESLLGKNEILERELEINRNERSELLNKLFSVTGLNSQLNPGREQGSTKIPTKIGRSQFSWPQLKGSLELKAREEYWERKKREKEASEGMKGIEKLEEELLKEEGVK